MTFSAWDTISGMVSWFYYLCFYATIVVLPYSALSFFENYFIQRGFAQRVAYKYATWATSLITIVFAIVGWNAPKIIFG